VFWIPEKIAVASTASANVLTANPSREFIEELAQEWVVLIKGATPLTPRRLVLYFDQGSVMSLDMLGGRQFRDKQVPDQFTFMTKAEIATRDGPKVCSTRGQFKTVTEIMSVAEGVVKERKQAESLRELHAAGITADVSGDGGGSSSAAGSSTIGGSAALPPWLRGDMASAAPPPSSRRTSKAASAAAARPPKAFVPPPHHAPTSAPPSIAVAVSEPKGTSIVGGGGSERKGLSPSPIVFTTVPQPRDKAAGDSASMVSGKSGKTAGARSSHELGAPASGSAVGTPVLSIEDLMAGIGDKRAVNGVAKQ
jgi:hypothetical protein